MKMKMKTAGAALAVVAAALISSQVSATVVCTAACSGDSLNDKFSDWDLDRYDVETSQTGAETFFGHDAGGTSTLIFTENNLGSAGAFGIYSVSNGTKVKLFDDSSIPTDPITSSPSTQSINFWGFGNNNLTVAGIDYLSFGTLFGFYIDYNGSTFFSETSKNGDLNDDGVNDDHFLAFRGDGGSIDINNDGTSGMFGVDDWVIASDFVYHQPDFRQDFDDMVIYVSEMQVPEPASLALFGLGLLGMGTIRRRRS